MFDLFNIVITLHTTLISLLQAFLFCCECVTSFRLLIFTAFDTKMIHFRKEKKGNVSLCTSVSLVLSVTCDMLSWSKETETLKETLSQ